MLSVSLKNNTVVQVNEGETAGAAIRQVDENLFKEILAVKINGILTDTQTPLTEDCTLEGVTFASKEGKEVFRHTAAHIMAQAIKRLFPRTQLAFGPATEDGFFYDIDITPHFTADDIKKIEAEMKKIVKENLPIEKIVMSKEEALAWAEANGPFKKEIIERHAEKGECLTFYKQGEFLDFCAGPHLSRTGKVKAYRLISASGVYWHGDVNNPVLCRVVGTAFPTKQELEDYFTMLENARKNDHNVLGRQLGFFTTVDMIGQGLPIMCAKGTKAIQLMQRFVEDEEEKRGYILTKTPLMAKSDLYKISGHWQHYRDKMFVLGDPEKAETEEVFALRPMTCPFQFQVYNAASRSYRDLPMRLNETSTLFRNESSGEMHGLIRVRQFTISEGHLACTPDQLEDEFRGCVNLAGFMLKTFGFDKDVSYRFSKWDENAKEKYIGDSAEWERVQNTMRTILDDIGLKYEEADGEAAFYGPKLDIQIKNVFGKEDTLVTIQIDFQLAERFGMTYVDKDGIRKFPYVIHRTSLGCYERTLAMLIEKFGGAMPTWLSYIQVMMVPISEKFHEYANQVATKLREYGIRVKVDERNEKMGAKIRDARLELTPYILITGEKEVEENTVSVRSRDDGDIGAMSLDSFIEKILKDIETKALPKKKE